MPEIKYHVCVIVSRRRDLALTDVKTSLRLRNWLPQPLTPLKPPNVTLPYFSGKGELIFKVLSLFELNSFDFNLLPIPIPIYVWRLLLMPIQVWRVMPKQIQIPIPREQPIPMRYEKMYRYLFNSDLIRLSIEDTDIMRLSGHFC